MSRLTDRQRIVIGRWMAVVSVVCAVVAFAIYVALDAVGEMYDEWALHNTTGAAFLAGLFWVLLNAQPRNAVVWVFGWAGLFQSLNALGISMTRWELDGTGLTSFEGTPRDDADVTLAVVAILDWSAWLPGIAPLVTLALLWFPDGRPPSSRWGAVSWLAIGGMSVATFGLVWATRWFGGGTYPDEDTAPFLFALGLPLIGMAVVLSIAALVVRYRRSRGAERRQLRWIVWAFSVVAVTWLAAYIIDFVVLSDPNLSTFKLVGLVTFEFLLASYGIAIWRHQLFDIDVVISRTLLFGLLAAFIGGVYVAVVYGLGTLIGQTSDDNTLSLAATVLVAFLFQPVRRQAERAANRLVYGKRATPYEVLSELTAQLNQTETSEGLLDRIAHRLGEGTGAETATVWRHEDARFVPAATWPSDVAPSDRLPADATSIERAGQTLGALSVSKPRGEELNPTEQRLIGDLAGSAGLILDRARLDDALTAQAHELFESRRRLADAQADERQRLQRQLRSSTQRQLADLGDSLAQAADAASPDLAAQIEALAGETRTALDEIDALAQGIYPPLLETEGLGAAVESLSRTLPITASVSIKGRHRHDPDTELAVYFCIAEALTNVVKHANATRAGIHLDLSANNVRFEVIDNGDGFDQTKQNGNSTGIAGLTDRLETIGGHIEIDSLPGRGTSVTGEVVAAMAGAI